MHAGYSCAKFCGPLLYMKWNNFSFGIKLFWCRELTWHEVMKSVSSVLPVSSMHKMCNWWPFCATWLIYILSKLDIYMWWVKWHLAKVIGASMPKLW